MKISESKERLQAIVEMTVTEMLLLNDIRGDDELNYPEFVQKIIESEKFHISGYLPPCKYVKKQENAYFVKMGCRKNAIGDLWYMFIADIFGYSCLLNLVSDPSYMEQLYSEFHDIVDRPYNIEEYCKLRKIVDESEYKYVLFQRKITDLLRKIVRKEISSGADITEYMVASQPYQDTVIGKMLEKIYSCSEDRYVLIVTDLNSREFKTLLYLGLHFLYVEHSVRFFCQVIYYYWER